MHSKHIKSHLCKKKSTFLDMYRFKTYINEFLDLEHPNFDPKHGFISTRGTSKRVADSLVPGSFVLF